MSRLPGFVPLLAGRLIRRRGAAPGWVKTLGRVAIATLVVVAVAIAVGLRGPVVIASLWLASLAGMIAILVARLRPMLVVSVLGLALGVAAMFVVLGVGSGVEGLLVSSLARLNGHAMVSKYGIDFFEYDEVASRLEADPRVRAASPYVFGVGAIVVSCRGSGDAPEHPPQNASHSGGPPGPSCVPSGRHSGEACQSRETSCEFGEPVVVTIKGVDPQRLARFSAAKELFAVGGLESLRPADPRVRPGIVLGVRLARRIGAEPGTVVRLVVPAEIRQDRDGNDGRPRYGEFEVTGLLETGFAEFDSTFVLTHLRAAQAVVFGEMRASGIELELRDARISTAMPVARSLVEVLNRPMTAQGMPPLYRAASWFERSAILTSIRQTKALLALIVSLIVVVASGSLIGALLILVRRERRHIGVLASLGARPRQLFLAFELVGVTIGGLGSLLGLALGSISLLALAFLRFDLDPAIYMVDHLPVAFVWTDMLLPTALAILVCAIVSGPIARRVGKIRPLELLG